MVPSRGGLRWCVEAGKEMAVGVLWKPDAR